MQRTEALQLILRHLERQFPKRCACCSTVYGSLRDYVRRTRHLGLPMAYDAEGNDFRPDEPLGAAAFSNCGCGSTLVVTSDGMARETLWKLLGWLQQEVQRTGLAPSAVLASLREELDAVALGPERGPRRSSTPVPL